MYSLAPIPSKARNLVRQRPFRGDLQPPARMGEAHNPALLLRPFEYRQV